MQAQIPVMAAVDLVEEEEAAEAVYFLPTAVKQLLLKIIIRGGR